MQTILKLFNLPFTAQISSLPCIHLSRGDTEVKAFCLPFYILSPILFQDCKWNKYHVVTSLALNKLRTPKSCLVYVMLYKLHLLPAETYWESSTGSALLLCAAPFQVSFYYPRNRDRGMWAVKIQSGAVLFNLWSIQFF